MSRSRGSLLAALAVSLLLAAPAAAQRATEQFIPIGRSPGLSGGRTLLGRVVTGDAAHGVLVLATAAGEHQVAIGEATRIWLDRSESGQSNTTGSLADCASGRTVEVRLAEDGETADWVKVRIGPGP